MKIQKNEQVCCSDPNINSLREKCAPSTVSFWVGVKMPTVDSKSVQIMVVLYNAVEDGWIVSKLSNSRYQFRKPTENVTQEVFEDDFPTNFLRSFASIDNFFDFLRKRKST